MLAAQKRAVGALCLADALRGDYKAAAYRRQQAYALDPPGSIGIDWSNWPAIWEKDFRYMLFMDLEDFTDVDNSDERIESLKAGIFIDYLFDFRDSWGVRQQSLLSKEPFHSDELERFLVSRNWTFECESRELIYSSTKKKNIAAKMYYDSICNSGLNDIVQPYIFPSGEYDLGFMPETPQRIIDARRHWLSDYDLFLKMQKADIEKFPKTFQTFQKHKKENSSKYRMWLDLYKLKGADGI